jgi:hypothetical protein
MVRFFHLTAVLVLLGCGSGDDQKGQSESPTASTCLAPAGQYEQVFTVKSGTCGPQSSSIVNLSEGGPAVGTFGSACNGKGSVTPDGCKYQVEIVCPSTPTNLEQAQLTLYGGNPPTITFLTTTNWNVAATHATGLWSINRTSPVAGCSGTYDVELNQL